MSRPEPTEEELRAALEEQMRELRVEDVVLQSIVTLVNLGGRRLGLAGDPAERDLGQARVAIEATRALLPVVPSEQAAPIRDALSQLQLAYAREAQRGGEPAAPREQGAQAAGAEAPAPEQEPSPRPSPAEEAERAKARARIWTPPGTG